MDKDKKLIITAMSGGVDSSAAAALLVSQGYRVVGVTMLLWPDDVAGSDNRCCSTQDLADARAVCAKLGIKHYSMDLREQFMEEVVLPFTDTYLAGKTPNPCILCNEHLKFRHLMRKARAVGADLLATGHYARITGNGMRRLARGHDPAKDQSYFLFPVDQEILKHLIFPLGELKKEEVRGLASELGLPVHEKPDSQEICFISEGGMRDFIRSASDGSIEPGPIVDTSGNNVGTHEGVCFYTVGQRRGLGVPGKEPYYIVRIEPENKTIVVGTRDEAASPGFAAEGVNWIEGIPPTSRFTSAVQIRHRHNPALATVTVKDDTAIDVVFDEPQHGVAPGQAAVLYDGDYVIGGGWIV